jgi:hypothetical protein
MPTDWGKTGYDRREALRRSKLRETLKAKGLLPGSTKFEIVYWRRIKAGRY